jgi:hypothetical protein
MRRFLLKIGVFAVVLAVLYLPAVWLLGNTPAHGNVSYVPVNYGHLRSRLADIPTHRHVDVLFLGSSHCYRTFDTRQYKASGYNAFNLGSSNQTPLQTLALLQTYLDTLAPRRVIFEVHPDIMSNDGVESSLDFLSNAPMNGHVMKMALSLHTPRTFNTLAYTLVERKLLHRDAGLKEDSIIRVKTCVNGVQVKTAFAYVSGGYVEVPCCHYRPQTPAPQTIVINPDQLQALRQCLSLLRERGIPYLLVEVPASRSLYNAYTNHRDFERVMSQQGTYLNLNDSSALTSHLADTLHYFDEDHLNSIGVQVVNSYIIHHVL